jgi:outer membrane protein assembly factor BamB
VVVNGARNDQHTSLYLSSGVTPIDHDPSLTAVNASTGAQIWRWHSYYKDSVPNTAGVSADGQTVFIGSGTSLYALESSSGQQRWDLNMHAAISTAPTFDATRNLIFIGVGANVYAIATFAKGPAVMSWSHAADRYDNSVKVRCAFFGRNMHSRMPVVPRLLA